MEISDFDFDLPPHLIAKYPTAERTNSKLLCLDRINGNIKDTYFYQLPDLLNENDLLVMNNSKVIPARVYGQKDSGGKVEMLIERITSPNIALVHLRGSKPLSLGRHLFMGSQQTSFTIIDKKDHLYTVEKEETHQSLLDWLYDYGHIPLPPYIARAEEPSDIDRYQTVYAKTAGSVAAPTAGLHFDENLLKKIRDKGVHIAYVTLHVGSGTFQPVRVKNIQEHQMHQEHYSLPQETCRAIYACRQRGGRVIAVGTTTVRALESAERSIGITPTSSIEEETNIFLYPGAEFKVVDAMITNFHLPKSTLVMLVSAFSTKKNIMAAYQHAIENNYRFFSYGDAMFISA